MKAIKTVGTTIGVIGVDVHFSISDLVLIGNMVDQILRDKKPDEETPASHLAQIMFKVVDGGLDLEATYRELTDEQNDIFDNKKKETEFDWIKYEEKDIFVEVEDDKDKQKTMVGVLIDLEAVAPSMQVVKDDEEPPMTE